MVSRNASSEEIKKNQKNQKMRIKVKKAARRSGKAVKEDKIEPSAKKKKAVFSQKKVATVKKSRY
ncbi:hypothetical protein C6988_04125 [Nitrosopumilus sp. b1]|uniref:hypothetical protein n=1 Tax=Nitrosopumilus sp. b1 TaxID=2109907 RepID=UPI000E2DBE2D|nr:hypothetical protein [Nitrosopumilus sp. b1]RDJ31616.1 MAG: hypothetical protein DWQ17_07140 [Thermoproteota archaeon]KAF6243268.1 hypothetical protein C6988_04125 [Nitrosopumilus sp. b1]RDJ33589.1 MAG: hypothetical protein DWQ18_05995 [Thermoproteota archaeon]RDJ38088.1 MAG: hypothetical protein DWQ19_01180 [Thermoproteota archaeon]RDJ39142.1 MAG: hypothetical protein DWQ13_02490 [Thermoproteota archaeon]